MMGPRQECRPKLFYTEFSLDARIRADHPLRQVARMVDFNFVRPLVRSRYGRRGNPSVDPVVLLKLMFLLFLEDVASERELMARMPERLDWMWFCGYDLDDAIPNHSVISKARQRWGPGVFKEFFTRILTQCIQAGLVDGRRVHVDSSLISANASTDRLQPVVEIFGEGLYRQLDVSAAMEDLAVVTATPTSPPPAEPAQEPAQPVTPPSTQEPTQPEASGAEDSQTPEASAEQESSTAPAGTKVTPVDPDARLMTKNGKTILGYKDHRTVDDRVGIITSTITTDASVRDPHMLEAALDGHERNTGCAVSLVAADKAYGTKENYKSLKEQSITPCIPHASSSHTAGMFPREKFHYDPARDCYVCPAGQVLRRRSFEKGKIYRYWTDSEVCEACSLRPLCTKNCPRRIVRSVDEPYVEWADHCLPRSTRRHWMRRRKIRAEGSFADAANNHGYKRARWRGLVHVTIQNLLIATAQNVRKLLKRRPEKPVLQVRHPAGAVLPPAAPPASPDRCASSTPRRPWPLPQRGWASRPPHAPPPNRNLGKSPPNRIGQHARNARGTTESIAGWPP